MMNKFRHAALCAGQPSVEKLGILALMVLLTGQISAERFHSYTNEKGARVYTNMSVSPISSIPKNTDASSKDGDVPYLSLINTIAQEFDLDADLVRAIVQVESNFNPQALSPKDCMGLMQLHPDTAKRFGVQDAFDPAQNIRGGVKYLKFLTKRFEGDIPLILAAYNAGETAIRRHKGIPPYRETQQYVLKVTALYQSFKPTVTPSDRTEVLTRTVLPNGSISFQNSVSN